ncbi:ATP-binding protein [Marinobacter sp. C2H3]|uniref:ATP-binding protein n=1 Tax=Marinobacter sp. C2H3 TaxID=3119003 RepID=UPI00300EB840
MPTTHFLKLYLRLAGLCALVLLACVLSFQGLNAVRYQFWLERFPEPLMRWLVMAPAPQQQYPWLVARFGLATTAAEDEHLSDVTLERLGYGQVVSRSTPVGYRLMAETPAGAVLSLNLAEPYQDVTWALAAIVRWHLDATPADRREAVAARLAQDLGVAIDPPEQAGDLPPPAALQLVSDRGLALYRDHGQSYEHAILKLSDGTLVRLSFAPPFSPWAWPVVILLVLMVGGVLALALFLALRETDNSLRQVESVAVRIARGDMGARVEASAGTVVGRLAAAFNGMAEHIQRLVQIQREMIHAVSHELRTPVARIRFGVQMIEDCESDAALRKQLDGIDGDIQELDELIDEILTYARLEQGGPVFSLTEASVPALVRQVVSEQQILRPNLTLSADIDEASDRWPQADIEPRYIHRAIQNLVGNAGRYAQSRVRVRCRMDEDTCRIDVEDDGPGIPEVDWEKVFTAFARLDDSRTRTSGGYGLGLSIVRRILYWHGGQAFVCRSDDLGGARFSLVWPRRKAPEASA